MGTKKKPKPEGEEKPVSRQRLWQIRQVELGRCRLCGAPLGAYSQLCDAHAKQRAESLRKKTGNKPWKKGSRGRPPKILSKGK